MDQVGEAIQNRGIWVIDRGGNRMVLYEPLLKNKKNFIIRMVGTRDIFTPMAISVILTEQTLL